MPTEDPSAESGGFGDVAGEDRSFPSHADRAAIARAYSANGASRRDSALRRARRARAEGHEDEAIYHEQVAAYHETHRVHEQRHADLEDALAAGSTVLEFEVTRGEHGPPQQPQVPKAAP
jgi:hypothetical protein